MGVDIKDAVSEEFSFEKEKAVAKKYAQRFQWEMILIGIGQACVWLSLWPLVMFGIIPLWLGFVVACFCACMAYLPSHEAQHGNYSSCLLYTSPSPRDRSISRMPSSA